MEIELVFNELSALPQPVANNIHTARQWMSTFIGVTVKATATGVKRVLRHEKDFFNTLLAPDYALSQWRGDKVVDRDEKRQFMLLSTKYPALIDHENTSVGEQYLEMAFKCNGQRAHGLGVAYLLEALAISFNSNLQWDKSQILLETPELVTVRHASRPDHIDENKIWIEQQIKKGNPWLKNNLPQSGDYPYQPPKIYYDHNLADFPTKVHGDNKVFIDDKEQYWLWDKQEKHWDVQLPPYGRDNYFRVWPDGRLVDKAK